jgi:hypothetical protein
MSSGRSALTVMRSILPTSAYLALTFALFLAVGVALNYGHAAPQNVDGALVIMWLMLGIQYARQKALRQ